MQAYQGAPWVPSFSDIHQPRSTQTHCGGTRKTALAQRHVQEGLAFQQSIGSRIAKALF